MATKHYIPSIDITLKLKKIKSSFEYLIKKQGVGVKMNVELHYSGMTIEQWDSVLNEVQGFNIQGNTVYLYDGCNVYLLLD